MHTRWFVLTLSLTLPSFGATGSGVAVIEKYCTGCHGVSKMSGLDLRTRETALKGGTRGPAIVPGHAADSLLVKAISGAAQPKMPPGKDTLSAEDIAAVRDWINKGADWSGGKARQSAWWAFQKPVKPAVPKVKNTAWVRTPVDAFILEKLEEKGLQPAPPASKLTLLRRVTFDVTGLPPTDEEIREFLADKSPEAYAKVVDRLLSSPRYGERWGRHWLDVARYADSTGLDEDHRYPHAWRYRDWVIEAFNEDMPIDRFIQMQVAGDLMPPPPSADVNREGIIATGFLALGPKPIAQQDKKQMLADVVDEQIDVTSKALLGVTLACARCHDHKFDPFPTKDYYSMASIFASTKSFSKVGNGGVSEMYSAPLVNQAIYERYENYRKRVRSLKKSLDEIREAESARYSAGLRARLADYMVAAHHVYRDNADVKAVAAKEGLKQDVLERWVTYLMPGTDPRPHLDAWDKAEPSALRAAAAKYQAEYEKFAAEWDHELEVWRMKVEGARKANMDAPPPPKPDVIQDPFFREVSFGKGPFALPEEGAEKVYSAASLARFQQLKAELAEVEKHPVAEPDMADCVGEGEPVQQRVFVRGSYNNLGDPVSKRPPLILGGEEMGEVKTVSGRLELARWLTGPDNPLTARVFVNRLWQWHFSEGIVRTPNNYGKLGMKPTHPELLDWLATTFVEQGWSAKKMHRLILLSNAYQMSSETSDAAAKADLSNQLFSRFPRRRLDVEEIRDSYLMLDNTIDWKRGGTLQTGVGTDGENSAKRLSLNPEDYNIRSVYMPLRRSNLPNLYNLFDFVDSTTSCEARSRTNVAPQALFVMNSEFVGTRAENLAKQLLAGEKDDHKRLERAYLHILNRPAQPEEIGDALDYIQTFARKAPGDDGKLRAWESYLRVLLGSNEYVYVD
jgi:cytochrome c553